MHIIRLIAGGALYKRRLRGVILDLTALEVLVEAA